MPITQSAKKALRQTKRRAARNLQRKEEYKNALKRMKNLLDSGNAAAAEKLVPETYRALDKAAKTGVLKPNAASRRKSRLMALIRKTKRPA